MQGDVPCPLRGEGESCGAHKVQGIEPDNLSVFREGGSKVNSWRSREGRRRGRAGN